MTKIIPKITGVLCVVLGIFFLFLMILIPIVFGGGHGASWEDLNWSAVFVLIALQLVFMTAGVMLLRWEHYQQRWQHHCAEQEARAADGRYSIAAEAKAECKHIQEAKKKEALQRAREAYRKEMQAKQSQEEALAEVRRRKEEERQKLLDIPKFPGSQRVSLYRNKHAGVANYIWCTLFLGMALGSLLAIPLIAERYEDGELLMAGVVLTVIFWIGFMGIIFKWKVCRNVSVETYVISNEEILYRVNFVPVAHQNRAVTKLGSIIENYRYLTMSSELHDKQVALMQSEAAVSMTEKAINENVAFPLRGQVSRLNSPCILRHNVFGARIRYWNETAERWEKITLLSSNEGFERICQVIQRKMDRYEANIH